jgi:hypothetical protein
MANYNVSLASKMANLTITGTQVTGNTTQEAQKAANYQAAKYNHVDYKQAWDWKATITSA